MLGPVLSVLPAQAGATGLTPSIVVVLVVVLLALVLFVTEALPIDVTAITIMVVLMVLGPWTEVSVAEGISGFSNPATVTVLAMLILSSGVSKTGLVQSVGKRMASFAGDNPMKQLGATIGVAGPVSGFINNTPVVAILVPVITDLAHEGKSSPSKLLMPLSFASMFGGMLTLIGTSTNILASSVAADLGVAGAPFSMFEFTSLGVVVLVVGSIYLMTVGYRLLPERVPARDDYLEEYEIQDYVTEVVVREDSPIVGETVARAIDDAVFDADILQITRDHETFFEGIDSKRIRAGDVLMLRTDRETLATIAELDGLDLTGLPRTEAEMEEGRDEQSLVEVVIQSGSALVGETLTSTSFRQRYDANVLAFRSRGETVRSRLDDVELRIGDTLLVQAPADSIDRLAQNPDFIVAREPEEPSYRTGKIPHAVAIIVGVVALASQPFLPVNIVVTALGGVVAMVLTGVLRPSELYESVDWDVIFLLAGVIPLGIAIEQSGAAALIGRLVASTGEVLPLIGVLWVFYIVTGLVTSVISNNASVVLMIPVAVETASRLGANAFAFVLAVTFAASTAFLSPVGYQTNLFVYGPGGYKFSDYVRVGAPLQVLLSVVTVLGIVFFWGVRPA
ncbi:SLC13 family permease [Halarchaeum grantii]|uniref:SLC13 family permease n=1 Tax=Halarchaeum grantii TaxID=1193105 RepID=A0A830F8R2_9EURY|nr:SLC13 family permease [Halarchaeum grantii]GGL30246.1 SLC13 family permease [Halarchaeum grantii]